jgi:ATP-dependent helicase/nuclease subunit B
LPRRDLRRKFGVQVRLLLGPAGSGKTFRCLAEIRDALSGAPEGPPLLLVAPKQMTFQLERQLLAEPSLLGYTRLHILSFERLADFVLEQLDRRPPQILDDEGRVMVLRALLAKKRDSLKLFRASARLTGFAQELSLALRELQETQLTAESLNRLAAKVSEVPGLAYKLEDLATLLKEYLDWLKTNELQDSDSLLSAATHALRGAPTAADFGLRNLAAFNIEAGWVDGFAEMSEPELELLVALLPHCRRATITFCLDRVPAERISWLSNWALPRRAYEQLRKKLVAQTNVQAQTELLPRSDTRGRFANNPILRHLERYWPEPRPFESLLVPNSEPETGNLELGTLNAKQGTFNFELKTQKSELKTRSTEDAPPKLEPRTGTLTLALCANPEAEAALAARKILPFVRAGGRFRDTAVLVRNLEDYHDSLERVFRRYQIPFFMDRREPIAHHPLAELTRNALRTITLGWLHEDWFAALKTGLVPAVDGEIDRLENEAMARGWTGAFWQQPAALPQDPGLDAWLTSVQKRLLPPFRQLSQALTANGQAPTGQQLASALRDFWHALSVADRLQQWAETEQPNAESRLPGSIHATVQDQLENWLTNVESGFADEALPLREWLPILEAGLGNLTAGVIPPALDQVLIGSIDRARPPEIKLAIVLGLNEGVFPARPRSTALLTEADRAELEKLDLSLNNNSRRQLGRERFYAYLALTRARERLVLTAAQQDTDGTPLNPSPFLAQLQRLFPGLKLETPPQRMDWRESEHVSELITTMLSAQRATAERQKSKVGSQSAESDKPNFELQTLNAELSTPNPEPGTLPSHLPLRPSHLSPRTSPLAPLPQSSELRTLNSELGTLNSTLSRLPAIAGLFERLEQYQSTQFEERLNPELVEKLYGRVLRTSVSRMEQLAACPFKFFVYSGLRAEERKLFELDVREQGSFQHDVLAEFHQQLRRENRRWRDITPRQAREMIGRVAEVLAVAYRNGLLQSSEQTRFMLRVMTASLQDFIETVVSWMRGQYLFDPVAVELPFGDQPQGWAWELELGESHRLAVQGRIDRIDLHRDPDSDAARCVVVDYKSRQRQLDPILLANGLQLQLLTYLNVARSWRNPREQFGVGRLIPAGVFYVSLRGSYGSERNRRDALADADAARQLAYRHTGRFDKDALHLLDSRPDARKGDQFNYRITKHGRVYKNSGEALSAAEFAALLDSVESNLREMGRQIYSGAAEVSPYRKGTMTACDYCDYRAICRIDPWTHKFRVLRKVPEQKE